MIVIAVVMIVLLIAAGIKSDGDDAAQDVGGCGGCALPFVVLLILGYLLRAGVMP